jgi:hypothetical protein
MSDDGWLSPGTSGVILGEFEAISRQMDKAAPVIDELAQQMWSILNSAGVDTAPAMKVKSIAEWADSAAIDIRRRLRLVHEMDRQDIAMAGYCTSQGTYLTLPDRYQDQLAVLDGRTAGDLLKKAANGDRAALTKLSAFANQARNPYFAKALLDAIGAKGLTELPAQLAEPLRDQLKQNQTQGLAQAKQTRLILDILRNALAIATDPHAKVHVDDQFLSDLAKEGESIHEVAGIKYPGYAALGTILLATTGKPPFSPEFMRTVGQDMIAYDQRARADLGGGNGPPPDIAGTFGLGDILAPTLDQPGAQPSPLKPPDYLSGLLRAAAGSAASAQALLDGTPPNSPSAQNTLTYLLRDRWREWKMGDRGDALGKALEVAAKGNDDASKRLAVLITQIRADDIDSFMSVHGNRWTISDRDRVDALSGLRDSLAVILGNHIDDVGAALQHPEVATRPDAGHEILQGYKERALFASDDLYRLLADIGRDEGAYKSLLWAQAAHMRKAIDDAYDLPGRSVVDWANMEAGVLGSIVAGYQEAQLAEGLSRVEAEKRANDSTQALLDFGIGLLPVPGAKQLGAATNDLARNAYESLGKLAYGDFGRIILNLQNSGVLDNTFFMSALENRNVADLVKGMIETSAIQHRGLDMNTLHRVEAQYERENSNNRVLLFTSGSGDGLQVLPSDTWTRDQWNSFHDYNADYNDPHIPDGRDQTQSLNKFREWGSWGYDNGFKELQVRLGINTYIPGGGNRP